MYNPSGLKRLFRSVPLLIGLLLFPLTFAVAGPTTQAGPYTVEITTDPDVIPVGKARLVIKLTDASSGKPVEGATLRALTKMPAMDMGERPQGGAPVGNQPGIYQVPAQFAMEGGYESTIEIDGPLGKATAHVPLQTGENTASATAGGPAVAPAIALGGIAFVAGAAFLLYRMRRTGQRVNVRSVLNGQVLGGLLVLGVIAAGSGWVVGHLRRPGALTPVEAQAMDMSNLPPPPGYAPVTLATVTRGAVTSHVRYTGSAVGYVEQDVSPRMTGTLLWMPLYAGDHVTKGQLLARLDTSQTAPQLAEKAAGAAMARASVSEAQAAVRQAQAEVEQAHAELAGKTGGLAEAQAGVTAAQEEEASAKAALESAQAQSEDARAQVAATQADQTYWRAQIERSATLLKAGAISGEEYQRDKAQADAAEAKGQQAQAQVTRMTADVQAARAALRKAGADVTAAGARVQMARSELDAHHSHVAASEAGVATAQQRVAMAESGVVQAAASEQSAAAVQGYSEIRSESDGVVTQRLISPGVLVNPGQAILRVAQIRPIRLQANVAEADLSRIRVGNPVTIRGSAEDGAATWAKITSIAPALDPMARTGVVEAVVSNTNARFLPGQYVVMDIATGRSAGGLTVPTRAIAYSTPDTGGLLTTTSQPYVWTAEKPGADGQYTVHRVNVTLGVRGDHETEIVSGLSEGQKVVLSGGAYLKDGDTVAEETNGDRDAGPNGAAVAAAATNGSGANAQAAQVTVTATGFQPSSLNLKGGVPARVTFTRTTNDTCATAVVFPDLKIKKDLPLNRPVAIEFTPGKGGEITFACGMNMFHGKVVVR